jgi:hypothetical protein
MYEKKSNEIVFKIPKSSQLFFINFEYLIKYIMVCFSLKIFKITNKKCMCLTIKLKYIIDFLKYEKQTFFYIKIEKYTNKHFIKLEC